MVPTITYDSVAGVYALNTDITPIVPTVKNGNPYLKTKATTFSGNTNNSVYPTNGTPTQATYLFPCGVATMPDGTTYVVDEMGPIIRKITPTGTSYTFAGSYNAPGGVIEYGHVDGQGVDAKFNNPRGLALDVAGNLYVTEYVGWVRKITPSGLVTTVAGTGVRGFFDNTNPLATQFNNPTGIAVDFDGTIYIADTDNHRIRKIATNGAVTTVAGSTAGNANGTSLTAKFRNPKGIAVDGLGNIFVCDTGNGALRKIDATGNVTTIPVSSGFFTLSAPSGIVYTDEGLFVADEVQNVIFKIDTLSNCTIHAGNGIGQFKNGICTGARTGASLYAPQGLGANSAGHIVVADRNSQVIRKIEPQASFTISPSLPTGLKINPDTGIITGKPSTITARTTYTVTSGNYDGICYASMTFETK